MKIALIGYGRMGHVIEKVAVERGHEIVCRIDRDSTGDFGSETFRSADVAIEFTAPTAAKENVLRCFAEEVPVVSGTTGWNDVLPEMKKLCDEGKGTLLQASNFSVGVNMFMAVNSLLAEMMNAFPQYKPHMVETHHVHKLDHPSGTAVTLAEQIIKETSRISSWCEPEEGVCPASGALEIEHIRTGEVPGIHTIVWDSPEDSITITHSAKTREGFALGAVMAAEWLSSRKGWHTIGEMFSEIVNASK